jgi:hypothetical protein
MNNKPRKKRKQYSPYLAKIVELKKKHGDFISWPKVGKEAGTSPQNARELYRVWVKNQK